MDFQAIGEILLPAVAVASVAVTISKSSVFRRMRLAAGSTDRLVRKLVSCPYCLSHWLSLYCVLLLMPQPFESLFLLGPYALFTLNFVVSWFAMVTTASILAGLIILLFGFAPDEPEEAPQDLEQLEELMDLLRQAKEEILSRDEAILIKDSEIAGLKDRLEASDQARG